MGDAGASGAEAGHLRVIEVDAVGEPDVGTGPAQVLDVVERRGTEALPAEGVLIGGLCQMGV